MKILHIFSPGKDSGEGLWSIEKEGESSEFEKLFNDWTDPEYMYNFCEENISDIQQKFKGNISSEDAASILMDEADELKRLLYNLSTQQPPGSQLQHLFKPLHNREFNLSELQLSKGSAKNREFKDPKLRIYAIRISENAYVVTGGAIKLTHLMEERPHTKKELEKLNVAKSWLKSEGINYPEDLKELL